MTTGVIATGTRSMSSEVMDTVTTVAVSDTSTYTEVRRGDECQPRFVFWFV